MQRVTRRVSGIDLTFSTDTRVVDGRSYPVVTVDKAAEELAASMRERRDNLYGNLYQEEETDMRWVGELGEMCLDAWLSVSGVPSQMLLDDRGAGKPDSYVCGQSVGIKTVKRSVPILKPPPDEIYSAQISEKHVDEPVRWYFFLSYEFQEQKMWLVGGIEKSRFLEQAIPYKEGEWVHRHYQVRKGHAIRNLDIRSLYSAQDWLAHIRSNLTNAT